MNPKSTGTVVAAAAAALFFAAPIVTAGSAQAAEVKCVGANACKGQSLCKTASSECKGHNSCKGKGWVNTKDAAECAKKGGKVEKS